MVRKTISCPGFAWRLSPGADCQNHGTGGGRYYLG